MTAPSPAALQLAAPTPRIAPREPAAVPFASPSDALPPFGQELLDAQRPEPRPVSRDNDADTTTPRAQRPADDVEATPAHDPTDSRAESSDQTSSEPHGDATDTDTEQSEPDPQASPAENAPSDADNDASNAAGALAVAASTNATTTTTAQGVAAGDATPTNTGGGSAGPVAAPDADAPSIFGSATNTHADQDNPDSKNSDTAKNFQPSSGTKPPVSADSSATAPSTTHATASPITSDAASLQLQSTSDHARAAAPPSANADGPNDADALNSARLERGLRTALNQKGGAVTLRLTPPEIGTVRIQLDLQGTTVSARFHAESDAGRSLLQQQLGQLRAALEGQGLSVDRLSVQSMTAGNSTNFTGQDADGSNTDGRSRGQYQSSSQNQQHASPDDADSTSPTDNFRDLFDSPDANEPLTTQTPAPGA